MLIMSTTTVDSVLEYVVEKFVSRKRFGVCFISSALLVHRLGKGDLVEGYLIFDSHRCYVRHYWCLIDGKDYDAGTIISTSLKIMQLPSRLSQTRPENYTYISSLNQKELTELEDGYRLYLTNRRKFWKTLKIGWIQRLL